MKAFFLTLICCLLISCSHNNDAVKSSRKDLATLLLSASSVYPIAQHLQFDLTSIVLVNQLGQQIRLFDTTRTVEWVALHDMPELLAALPLPADTYKSLRVNVDLSTADMRILTQAGWEIPDLYLSNGEPVSQGSAYTIEVRLNQGLGFTFEANKQYGLTLELDIEASTRLLAVLDDDATARLLMPVITPKLNNEVYSLMESLGTLTYQQDKLLFQLQASSSAPLLALMTNEHTAYVVNGKTANYEQVLLALKARKAVTAFSVFDPLTTGLARRIELSTETQAAFYRGNILKDEHFVGAKFSQEGENWKATFERLQMQDILPANLPASISFLSTVANASKRPINTLHIKPLTLITKDVILKDSIHQVIPLAVNAFESQSVLGQEQTVKVKGQSLFESADEDYFELSGFFYDDEFYLNDFIKAVPDNNRYIFALPISADSSLFNEIKDNRIVLGKGFKDKLFRYQRKAGSVADLLIEQPGIIELNPFLRRGVCIIEGDESTSQYSVHVNYARSLVSYINKYLSLGFVVNALYISGIQREKVFYADEVVVSMLPSPSLAGSKTLEGPTLLRGIFSGIKETLRMSFHSYFVSNEETQKKPRLTLADLQKIDPTKGRAVTGDEKGLDSKIKLTGQERVRKMVERNSGLDDFLRPRINTYINKEVERRRQAGIAGFGEKDDPAIANKFADGINETVYKSFASNELMASLLTETNPMTEQKLLLMFEEFVSGLDKEQGNKSLLFDFFEDTENSVLKDIVREELSEDTINKQAAKRNETLNLIDLMLEEDSSGKLKKLLIYNPDVFKTIYDGLEAAVVDGNEKLQALKVSAINRNDLGTYYQKFHKSVAVLQDELREPVKVMVQDFVAVLDEVTSQPEKIISSKKQTVLFDSFNDVVSSRLIDGEFPDRFLPIISAIDDRLVVLVDMGDDLSETVFDALSLERENSFRLKNVPKYNPNLTHKVSNQYWKVNLEPVSSTKRR